MPVTSAPQLGTILGYTGCLLKLRNLLIWRFSMRTLAVVVAVAAMLSVSAAKDEIHVADLVKQNLNSIGTEQARAAVKNRAVEGTLQFRVLSGGAGTEDGKEVLLSEGDKLVSLLKLPNPTYHGERFVSDGKKTVIAMLKPGVYSNIGQFVLAHNEILTEGLWGGTLSTGWPLANLDEHHAKLKYQGLKQVGGRELHRVDYTPKHSDLEIQLYFEPDTFRHVLTVYELTIKPQLGLTERETAGQEETRYRLEERFAVFKSTDNLTLPGKWTVQFTSEVPEARTNPTGGGSTTLGGSAPINEGTSQGHPRLGAAIGAVSEFDVTVTNISHNVQLDPKNFEVK
jgi:hypothetical protein